jgi:hypothetical protein
MQGGGMGKPCGISKARKVVLNFPFPQIKFLDFFQKTLLHYKQKARNQAGLLIIYGFYKTLL